MATIKVFLKDDVEKAEGFEKKASTAKVDREIPNARFAGALLQRNEDRWTFEPNDVTRYVPPALSEFVDSISLVASWELQGLLDREAGIYQLGTAKAEVLPRSQNRVPTIEIQGTKMEEISELLEKIKAGTIRPTLSFAQPQVGPTYEELAARLESAEKTIGDFHHKISMMEMFMAKIRDELWPFARKKKIVERLAVILARDAELQAAK